MEDKKLYKPKSCDYCPAVRLSKDNTIYCGCAKELKARVDKPSEKEDMWKHCELAWDKPEGDKRNDK